MKTVPSPFLRDAGGNNSGGCLLQSSVSSVLIAKNSVKFKIFVRRTCIYLKDRHLLNKKGTKLFFDDDICKLAIFN